MITHQFYFCVCTDKTHKDVSQGLDLLHSSADWCQKSTIFASYALFEFDKFRATSYNMSVHVNAWVSWVWKDAFRALKSTAVFSGIQSLRNLCFIVCGWSQR